MREESTGEFAPDAIFCIFVELGRLVKLNYVKEMFTEMDYKAEIKAYYKDGYRDGIKEKAKDDAKKLLAAGVSPEIIASCIGLSIDDVMALDGPSIGHEID